MIVIGLTGSIGMGKTTVAGMLERLGIPVHEADAEVHRLLAPGGKAYRAVAAAFPYFSHPQIYGRKTKSGARSFKRAALGQLVFNDEKKRVKLERIIHPLVREAQSEFIRKARAGGIDVVALDIPLLFETGAETFVDCTINVSAPANVQRARVLARPGMDEKKLSAILKRQMPDGEKCARADYVLKTGLSRAHTLKNLKTVLAQIRKKSKNAGQSIR
jgi:dephospho-CoA kinase